MSAAERCRSWRNVLAGSSALKGIRRRAALACLTLGCGALASASWPAPDDLPAIEKRGSLRLLAVLDAHRPEFFSTDAKAPGFEREILNGFAALHKVKIEVVALPSFDDLIPALLARKGDIIAGGYRDSATRRKSVAFSSEVFPNRFVVVTLRPHPVITNLEELRKERVGTTRGTATAEAALAAGLARENIDDGIEVGAYIEALRARRVTAAIWSVERALPAQREDPDLQLGMYLGQPGSLAFATRKEDTQLLAALNGHIEAVRRSGAWNRLVIKYFGENALQILKGAGSH